MKEPWSSDRDEILMELISIANRDVSVSIYSKKGEPPFSSTIHGVCGHAGSDYLVLKKPSSWQESPESCVLYKKKGEPSKGFLLKTRKSSGKKLAAAIPDEIFQINLRKQVRVDTPSTSKVSFFLKNKGKLNACGVKDISSKGACLVGYPESHIEKGDELGPVTLTLTMASYKTEFHDIVVPVARVARIQEDQEGKKVIGIAFQLDNDAQEQMNKYMDLLVWESDKV